MDSRTYTSVPRVDLTAWLWLDRTHVHSTYTSDTVLSGAVCARANAPTARVLRPDLPRATLRVLHPVPDVRRVLTRALCQV